MLRSVQSDFPIRSTVFHADLPHTEIHKQIFTAMRKVFFLLIPLVVFVACDSDEEEIIAPEPVVTGLLDKVTLYDELEREYLLYIPESYTGEEAVPLVFDLHTDLGTKENQY